MRGFLWRGVAAWSVAASLAGAAPPGAKVAVSARLEAMLGGQDLRVMVPDAAEVKVADQGLIRPDLLVTGAVWTPTQYLPPAKLHLVCTVRNEGPAAAGPFHIYCFAAGSLMPQSAAVAGGLKPGESTTSGFDFEYAAGPVPATAFADYANEVVENDETNNQLLSAPTLAASAHDFQALDLELAYDPHSLLGELFGNAPVTQPFDGAPLVVKARVGYASQVDQQPLPCTIQVLVDGVLGQSYQVVIPANGLVEVVHPVVLAAGDHTLQVGPANPGVDQTPAGNTLSRTWRWRSRARPPYRHVYFAINNYDAVGGGGNLNQSLNEGRRFANQMVALGHPHTYHAEDGGVDWKDWSGGPSARANTADIAYFAGHGNSDGPFYAARAFQGQTLMMVPAAYRLGRDGGGQTQLRWAVWSACETLYDGVTDQSHVNWDGPSLPLNRWFQVYTGLHAIVGLRSLGWQGHWTGWSSGDTRQRGSDFVNLLTVGAGFSWAWFLANRYCVWDELDRGFESAVLSAEAEGTDYSTESFTAPYPGYLSTPTGYYYDSWRIGSPSW